MDRTMIALPDPYYKNEVLWYTYLVGEMHYKQFRTSVSKDITGLCVYLIQGFGFSAGLRFSFPSPSFPSEFGGAFRHVNSQTSPATIEFVSKLTLMRTLTDLAVILRRSRMDSSTRDILVSLIVTSKLFDSFENNRDSKIHMVQAPLDFITVATTPHEEDESHRMKPLEVGQ
jgi:hypothetical protein